jgi:predicted dehydrogenase
MNQEINFAVIGAGGFARFAVAQFVKRPGARLVGVYDTDPGCARSVAAEHPGIKTYASFGELMSDAAVDLVYIGSPPFLHHEQSLAALEAGKHVICEKPAAIAVEDAEQLRRCAAAKGLLFVVNLMQRYNPLFAAVKTLVDEQLLGAFLHGFFENYASDEALSPGHWFWDDSRAGGIFIEHGVHFFDMFEGWLGGGEVIAAQRLSRPGHPGIRDIAQCDMVYRGNAPVHFFHGFNQPKILDRQEMRLQFERGDVTLHEWVPNRLVMRALCTASEASRLEALFPSARITTLASWGSVQTAQGRFKPIEYDREIQLDTGDIASKTALYEALVRAMFDDQLDWLADRTRKRVIDSANAVASLATAAGADRIAVRLT